MLPSVVTEGSACCRSATMRPMSTDDRLDEGFETRSRSRMTAWRAAPTLTSSVKAKITVELIPDYDDDGEQWPVDVSAAAERAAGRILAQLR